MSWNYRVMKRKYDTPDEEDYYAYEIHEVYYNNEEYDEKQDGSVKYYTKNAIYPVADSPEELKEILERMLKSLDEPIIEYQDD